MNKWLSRAVGTAGVAGGFLLLTAAQAQAAQADQEVLPLSGLQDGGLPLLSDLLGNAASPAGGGTDSLLGGLLGTGDTTGRAAIPHPAAQFLGVDSDAGPRSELGGDGGLLGALTGLNRPAESPRPGLSGQGLPGLTMLSALTGQNTAADRAGERPVAAQPGRHRAKPSPTRTRALPAQSAPHATGAHRADDGPRHAAATDDSPRVITPDVSPRRINATDDGPRRGTADSPRRATGPDDSPRRATDDSPRRIADDSPRRATDNSPRRIADDSPRRATDDSPRRIADDSPRRATDNSPRRIADDSPRRATDNSPRRVADDSPRRVATPAPGGSRRTVTAPNTGRRSAPDPGRGGGTVAGHPADTWTAPPAAPLTAPPTASTASPSDDGAITVTPGRDDQGFGRAPAHLAESPQAAADQAESPRPAPSSTRERPAPRAGDRPVAGPDPDYS
ncbi:hypothetical protein J2S43_006678 [Catenuloplanes nepalensis]|uniref:Uncharacterized protein n=1 Tax=Catenuloplanes nepalensis TaxID=587533 RepID=A0ABT9N416_9ACTN|nr:hypothetical protein [Catenuloplanes nepalensis]MDP9798166.1 hypothetical protein [Catenuloplanes nepalensis]